MVRGTVPVEVAVMAGKVARGQDPVPGQARDRGPGQVGKDVRAVGTANPGNPHQGIH